MVKVTFTEVSFEHAWIEVSVSICFQGKYLSRFGAVANQWKLRTSKSCFEKMKKSQNVRIFHTSRRTYFEQLPKGAISPTIREMPWKSFHVRVKVTFTEVSFEHAWIEVSVSICVQGQSLSRFGAVAQQWKLRTSKSWFGKIQNHKMSESFTLLACCVSCFMCCQCRLVMLSKVGNRQIRKCKISFTLLWNVQ